MLLDINIEREISRRTCIVYNIDNKYRWKSRINGTISAQENVYQIQ
ncbi:MAG: hypothetical protein K0S91_2805 [Nitrososphaeraceae archaeon]|nr:hypothetical protein [Nitrososphaeraceae archaeon]